MKKGLKPYGNYGSRTRRRVTITSLMKKGLKHQGGKLVDKDGAELQ